MRRWVYQCHASQLFLKVCCLPLPLALHFSHHFPEVYCLLISHLTRQLIPIIGSHSLSLPGISWLQDVLLRCKLTSLQALFRSSQRYPCLRACRF